jgi:hypothetical protein
MSTKDIASLPVAELRKRAKAAGITGYSKLKKAALVKALGGGSTKLKAAASHVPGRFIAQFTCPGGGSPGK